MADTPQTRIRVPAVEKIGLAIALFIALILVGIALFSLFVDLILKFNIYGIMVDLIVSGIGILLAYFSIRIYKKSAYYESLVNTAFDRGIYERLEPVLRKVAETHVEMESVEGRLNKIDRMVQTLIEEHVKRGSSHIGYPQTAGAGAETGAGAGAGEAIAPGTSVGFIAKVILLTVVSMSAFIIMVETSFGMAHLATLFLFILWWLLITSEYNVFDKNTAWLALFLPIILVPFSFMFLSITGILGLNNLLGIFYSCLALYAFLYYTWAVYETAGTLPLHMDYIRGSRSKSRSKIKKE